MDINAQLIASLMQANGDAHRAGRSTRAEWIAEQTRLWVLAGRHGCAADVLRLVVPTMGGAR